MDSKIDNKLILFMWVRWACKNTMIYQLLSKYSEYFAQALSCKTRNFRTKDGETEGVSYYKLTIEDF